MAFANGIYSTRYMNDLGCCGCQSGAPAVPAAGGFDPSSIPTWAWIAAAIAAGYVILKKK